MHIDAGSMSVGLFGGEREKGGRAMRIEAGFSYSGAGGRAGQSGDLGPNMQVRNSGRRLGSAGVRRT